MPAQPCGRSRDPLFLWFVLLRIGDIGQKYLPSLAENSVRESRFAADTRCKSEDQCPKLCERNGYLPQGLCLYRPCVRLALHLRIRSRMTALYVPVQEFDIARMRRYAARVAAEATTPLQKPIFTAGTVNVAVDQKRRVGFLGLRRETHTVVERRTGQVEIVPPYWVLFHTNHWIEDKASGAGSEYNEQNYWVLTENGALMYVWKWEECKDGRFESDVTATEMSPEKMLHLDYAHPRYDLHQGKLHIWGDREAGKSIRHAPGVGLSLALKRLIPKD